VIGAGHACLIRLFSRVSCKLRAMALLQPRASSRATAFVKFEVRRARGLNKEVYYVLKVRKSA
jgi:hypothetical protein